MIHKRLVFFNQYQEERSKEHGFYSLFFNYL